MLVPGMLDMSRAERMAVDKLLLDLGEPKAGISRAEPGEKGPLLVKVEGRVWAIDGEGVTTELARGGADG